MRRITLLCLLALGGCDDTSPIGAQAEGDAARPEDAAGTAEDGAVVDADTTVDASLFNDAEPADAASSLCGDQPCIEASDCDPLQPALCALPWPSSQYLQPNDDRDTGFELVFGDTTLPASARDVHVDPTPYRRMDGYGVGVSLIVLFPNVDSAPLPDESQIADSLSPTASILFFEDGPDGLVRIPYFVDADRREADPTRRVLLVRPAVLLRENTRYVAAFRDLQDLDGLPIAPSRAFAALVAGEGDQHPGLADRVDRFEAMFTDLEAAGVPRAQLTLAWDFQTASHRALHGELLQMRDAALETVGELGPQITFNQIVERSPDEDPEIAFDIQGTVRVPHFMRESGPFLLQMGWEINRDEADAPAQNGWRDAPFWLRIPRRALSGEPMGLLEYGHGLNGTGAQVLSGHMARLANREGLLIFAGNMVGMSSEDVRGIVRILTDLSWFPWIADRLHQGLLDYLLLARAMKGQLAQMPWIIEHGIQIDPEQLYYTGDSQGGIFGGTYMALSTDTVRGVLGVPGQNYSTMLTRSVDFDPFMAALSASYRGTAEQAVLLSALQVLWDRTDPVSHYRHLSEGPHENTPPHRIIAAMAKGDYQVPLITLEIVARSQIGVALAEGYDAERSVPLVDETAYPIDGSAIVNWPFGNPWPALGNLPPTQDEIGDPHGKPRKQRAYQDQMMHFFRTGVVIDVREAE